MNRHIIDSYHLSIKVLLIRAVTNGTKGTKGEKSLFELDGGLTKRPEWVDGNGIMLYNM